MADLAIDRYRVDRLIGQGAMGKIYLATDPKLERPVAIKMLNRTRADDDIRRRFTEEARSIAGLKHPNIVELYDYSDADEDELFLILEYVPGRTLYEHVTERGPMSEVTALAIGHELCLALMHAHGRDVVHRDLKPENVMLSDGRVVLMDFGIVKKLGLDKDGNLPSKRTRILGTPGFMAPEQLRGENVVPQTDLFGLGALLYNLVTGHAPFEANNVAEVSAKNLEARYDDPRAHNPMLSDGFCQLIDLCLTAKVQTRIKDAGAAKDAILKIMRGHGVNEVRQEIQSYQRDPLGYKKAQDGRRLEVLEQDLRLAVRDGDQRRVTVTIKQMRLLAPLEKDVREVTGLRWDKRQRPILLDRRRKGAGRWPAFIAGLLSGLFMGVIGGFLLIIGGAVPSKIVAWIEQLVGY